MTTGTIEFRWAASDGRPELLDVLEWRHRADEALDTVWSGLPGPRFKVLAISRDLVTETGWLTATVELIGEDHSQEAAS